MRAIRGQVIIKIDARQKEKFALTQDVTIEIIKGFDFNLRNDRASYGYIVNGNGHTKGDRALCHHLALEPNYQIENETILTEVEKKEGFKVISIPVDMLFATSPDGKEWVPCKDFLITQRIFLPYRGKMVGIDHQLVKNRMHVISGMDEWGEVDLSGKCVVSLDNTDYEIIFHREDNKEYRLIRSRSREIIAIDEKLTKGVNKGRYLVGLSPTNCKALN